MKPYKSALEIICSNIAYERKHPDIWTQLSRLSEEVRPTPEGRRSVLPDSTLEPVRSRLKLQTLLGPPESRSE